MKRCTYCEVEKPLEEYYKAPKNRKGYPDGKLNHCKECHKASCFRSNIKKRYGLTIEEYREMKAAGCAICGTHEGRIVIDHDHRNGKVRAALCNGCNVMLGAGADNPEILRRGVLYLEEWKSSHE